MRLVIYLKAGPAVEPIDVSVSVRDGFVGRLVGALALGGIPVDRGLLFPDCRQVHTWFMRRPISVLTFDASGRILSYHPEIPPFRIMPYEPEGSGLLELAPRRLGEVPERLEKDEAMHLLLDSPIARRAGLPALERDAEERASSTRGVSGNDRP